MTRRLLPLLAAFLALAGPAGAQSWPTRPVTLLVPYVPGGPSDTLARAVAGPLGAAIGQSVVVENRPGGNGSVAAQATLRAAPDGHTLFIAASGILTVNPHVMARLPYDPVRDFAPVTVAISAPNLLVTNPALPAATVPELLAWLRAHPGEASYGTSGIGSSEHLSMELFAQRTGTRVTHVPYPGGGAAVTDLLAGTLQLSFLNIATVVPHVQAGTLRAVAVGGATRHPLLPALPTVAEAAAAEPSLAGFVAGSWHGVVAPRGTPEAVLDRVHEALVTALRTPEVAGRLARIGFAVEGTSRADFAARIARELAEWREVVRAAGVAAQ